MTHVIDSPANSSVCVTVTNCFVSVGACAGFGGGCGASASRFICSKISSTCTMCERGEADSAEPTFFASSSFCLASSAAFRAAASSSSSVRRFLASSPLDSSPSSSLSLMPPLRRRGSASLSEALFFFSLPSFFSLFGPSSSLSSVRKALQNLATRKLEKDVAQKTDCVAVGPVSAPPGLKSSSSGSESSAPIGGSMPQLTRRQRRHKYNEPEESRASGRCAPHAGCTLR